MSSYLFRPLIEVPTRFTLSSATLIDNIFTNSTVYNEHPGVFMADISDHLPIFAILDRCSRTKAKFVSYRSNNRQALTNLYEALDMDIWKETLCTMDPNLILDSINSKLHTLYNKYFPLITKRARIYKTKLKPWLTTSLLKCCKTKNKLYKAYLKHKTPSMSSKYKRYKNKLTSILMKCEKVYYSNLIELHKTNLKETWRIIKDLLNRNGSNHNCIPLIVNGIVIDDPTLMANEFNNYFVAIGPKMAAKVPTTDQHFSSFLKNPNPSSMFIRPVDANEVSDIISNLKDTKPCNTLELPVSIYKEIAVKITEPLVHLINQSFLTGIVPVAMKVASITPLFKAGCPKDVSNYRPISKLPCFSKILERAMHNRLTDFLEQNNVLYNKQFGFRKNHSTTFAIVEVVDKISEAIDRRQMTVGVFLDLSKAFDTIRHEILWAKLDHYGIRGLALNWFKSYLTDRTQQVCFADTRSNLALIRCGVPQGSILGPLLFLLYINDITNSTANLLFYLFADDTTVFITGDRGCQLASFMTKELMHLCTWFHANFLSLNPNKSCYIIFTGPRIIIPDDPNFEILIESYPIKRVSHVKFLGIILDEHLTWRKHIDLVHGKSAKMIGIMRRLKHALPSNTIRTLYNAFILPYFSYGLIVWAGGYKTLLQPLLLLQKKVVRIIAGTHYLAHTASLFKDYSLLTITDLYKLQLAIFMYRYHKGTLPKIFDHYFSLNASLHDHNTRIKFNLHPTLCRTNVRRFTVRLAGPKIWNAIDIGLRNIGSLNAFKNEYKRYLISSCV